MKRRWSWRNPSEQLLPSPRKQLIIFLRFWRAHNDHILTTEQQTTQLASLRAAYAADMATLEKLERTNVYNDAFCIGHDGVFGTINGLRLGRVPGVPVGLVPNSMYIRLNVLLRSNGLKLTRPGARRFCYCIRSPESLIIPLSSRAPSFEVTDNTKAQSSYRLVPMGSFSRIEKTTGDKANYELYGSGDLHFGRLLHNRRFDIAMVAFLDCLKHLVDHVKSQDSSVDFPHQYAVAHVTLDVYLMIAQNIQGPDRRRLRQVTVQPRGGLDPIASPCSSCAQNLPEMDDQWNKRLIL